MLDDDDRVPRIYQALQHMQEPLNVGKVQPDCGLIQDIHGAARCGPREFPRQLDTLCLTTRERCGGLTQAHIAKTDIVERLELLEAGRYFCEKAHRLFHRHIHYIGDLLALVPTSYCRSA